MQTPLRAAPDAGEPPNCDTPDHDLAAIFGY
jgi:hypothetical protein